MNTTSIKKLTNEIKKEVGLLRSFVIGHAGKDSEGEYNSAFVKETLKAASEKPKHEFTNSRNFLKHVRSK